MKAISQLVNIKKDDCLTTEYIEKELTKLNIIPLRWAIVNVSDKMYTISVANIQN